MRTTSLSTRRGLAIIAVVVTMLTVELVIAAIVLAGARDHDLTVRRVDTDAAFYAAEGGINMAMREAMEDDDEDTDGTIGEISDDGNAANDPVVGKGRVSVASVTVSDVTTLTATGRSGSARRKASMIYD